MAQVCFTVPDSEAINVRDAMADFGGWDAANPTDNDPANKTEFARQVIVRFVRGIWRDWTARQMQDETGGIT